MGITPFEKIMTVFVAIMGLCFITSMILVIPGAGEILSGMVPRIPKEENAHLIAAGMAGTTLSAILFVIGIVSAGLSTVFPIILIAPWLICDYANKPRHIQSPMYRILGGIGLMLGLTVPVFGGRSVFIMIASQAFQALLMPMVALAIIILLNRRQLMQEHKAGWWLNLACGATFVFSLVMAYSGALGLIDMIKETF